MPIKLTVSLFQHIKVVNQLLDQTYDYIIAGAGIGGLITANRLTEDENTRVLVIEAGGNGDDVRERIDIPAQAYLDGKYCKITLTTS